MVKFVFDVFKKLTKESHLVGNMNIENFDAEKIRFGRTKSSKLALSTSRTAPSKICQ